MDAANNTSMSILVYRHFNDYQTHNPVLLTLQARDGRTVRVVFDGLGWRELP